MKLKIRPLSRDENIGVIKKSVSISDNSITTPTKAIKYTNIKSYLKEKKINEISKRINLDTLKNFYEKDAGTFCKKVKDNFLSNCFNFVFFNLIAKKFPDDDLIDTFGRVIYPASDKIICLPYVQKATLSSPTASGKSQRIDPKKVDDYLIFQQKVIDAINFKNSKDILGRPTSRKRWRTGLSIFTSH